jgi:hypothetical protein
LTASKFVIIILSFILFYNTAVAVAKPSGVLKTPSNGDDWLSEINKTIEDLIESNKESSEKMEKMTGEIQSLTETLVALTLVLIAILPLSFIIQWVLYRKRQNTIRKNKKKAYPYYRVRKKRFYLK